MIYYFSLEGNIAAGKSTLINKLQTELLHINSLPVVYLKEPVDLWQTLRNDSLDDNILEKFYKDKSRYAFTFQVAVMTTLRAQLRDIQVRYTDCILITERSIHAGFHVFSNMLFDEGHLQKFEYDILDSLYQELSSYVDIMGIIYLDVPVEVCYDRIIKRGRPGETIELHYLNQLEKYYKRFTSDFKTLEIHDGGFDTIKLIRDYIFETTSIDYLSKC